MGYLFFCFTTLTVAIDYYVLKYLAPITAGAHGFCLGLAPNSIYVEGYKALVCGADPSSPEQFTALRELGLYHILIVSGAHLQFLALGLRSAARSFNPRAKHLILPCLFIYTLVCRLDPPVLRAYLQIGLSNFNHRFRLRWGPSDEILLAGLLLILIRPTDFNGLSLLMSWTTALAIALGRTELKKAVIVYVGMAILMAPFSSLHPLSVFANLLLAPILGAVLFPLSAIAFVVPATAPFVDSVWRIFLNSCQILAPDFYSPLTWVNQNKLLIWALFLFAQFLYAFRHNLRGKIV